MLRHSWYVVGSRVPCPLPAARTLQASQQHPRGWLWLAGWLAATPAAPAPTWLAGWLWLWLAVAVAGWLRHQLHQHPRGWLAGCGCGWLCLWLAGCNTSCTSTHVAGWLGTAAGWLQPHFGSQAHSPGRPCLSSILGVTPGRCCSTEHSAAVAAAAAPPAPAAHRCTQCTHTGCCAHRCTHRCPGGRCWGGQTLLGSGRWGAAGRRQAGRQAGSTGRQLVGLPVTAAAARG